MGRIKALVVASALVLFCAACQSPAGSVLSLSEGMPSSTIAPTRPSHSTKHMTTVAPTQTPTPGTSRGNPVPVGGTIIGDDGIETHVVSLQRGVDASATLKSYNRFSGNPKDGMEYVLLRLHLRYIGGQDETKRVSSDYYRIVGEQGAIHESEWRPLGTTFAPELFVGGTTEGEVLFQVQEDEQQLVLIYSGPGTSARFLALSD